LNVELEVDLPDQPGQLIKCLEPISTLGGNILRITHHRDRKRGQITPVSIHFEVENMDVLEQIRDAIEQQQGVHVVKWEQEFVGFKRVVLLIGHVFEKGITDIIIHMLEYGVLVNEVNARITRREDVSTVKFSILGDTEEKIHGALQKLHEICKEKDLFLIRS